MSDPQILNHYRILGPLGRGGMGEVFVAEDTRLHRKVALKILPALMAADPERRTRFEREAQAVAAINHPNIVTIHSVEEADGVPFLTMELVEGKPLNELMSSGALPLDTLLRAGLSISDAIAAAHQRGITHRDLKPANVMVTTDGRFKVLDFGLAKLREEQVAGGGDDVTRMPGADLTGEGRIIGTVAYMSPEQAEGKPVDQRSDIFSLGVMLHEMATGEKPFKGDTNVSVISSILKDNPSSITDLKPGLPDGLSRVIRRSLAKDPSRRYQTATDLRNELEELKAESDSGISTSARTTSGTVPRSAPGRRSIVLAGSVIVVLAAAVAGYFSWKRPAPVAQPMTFEADRLTRLTSSGKVFLAALSRDGRYVVHVKGSTGMSGLWIRQTATTSDVEIVPAAEVRYDGVTFAPDGNHVCYVVYSLTGGLATLYRIPILGGAPQKLLEDVDSRVSFSPDGRQFTFMRGDPTRAQAHVMVANSDGTGARPLATLSGDQQFQLNAPSWSPDGRVILASAQSLTHDLPGYIVAVDATTGTMTPLQKQWVVIEDLEWLPDGRSFAVSAADPARVLRSQIWRVPYPESEPRAITNDLNHYQGVTFSSDGKLLLTVQSSVVSNLWVAPASDLVKGRPITTGSGRGDGLAGMQWTPDGRVVYGSSASGRAELWISNADGTGARQLTNDEGPSLKPAVTPDGRYILFHRFGRDGGNIWRMGIDGSDPKQLTHGGMNVEPVADNNTVYYGRPVAGSPRTWKIPIDGGDPVMLRDYRFRPIDLSPDGTRLLGTIWDEKASRSAVAIIPVGGGSPQIIPEIPTFSSRWASDGRAITFWAPYKGAFEFFRFVPGGKVPQSLGRLEDVVFGYAWSRDGKQIAIARGQSPNDVVLISAKPSREP
ncbi:MAG: protein kinase [Vicinamibacterales bacterium]